MNATKHTPGPWEVNKKRLGAILDFEIRAEHELAFDLAVVHDGGREGNAEANARLIAAAPELLEACCLFLRIGVHHVWKFEYPELWADTQAAIAKATGQPVSA